MVLNHHTGGSISCQSEVGFQSDPLPDFATALFQDKEALVQRTRKEYNKRESTIATPL
jgi:hypothetical protein